MVHMHAPMHAHVYVHMHAPMYVHMQTCMHTHTHTHTELDDESIPHVLGIIYPRLESQLMLAKNVQLIEALREIKIHEEDTSFLSPQCQEILGNDQQFHKLISG